MAKQSELIQQMSDRQLTKQLIISQSLLLAIGFILSLLLFDDLTNWFSLFTLDIKEIMYYGVLPGFIIVTIDLISMYIFPKRYYDDDGINDKIFSNRSVASIAIIALFVAVTEEFLFRGVLQTTIGYALASTFFALVHFRYLKKIVLLISVLFVSFYIGYIFELTENLFATITAHFTVDFILGLLIRFRK